MKTKKPLYLLISLPFILYFSNCSSVDSETSYSEIYKNEKLQKPTLSYNPPTYSFKLTEYNNPEYNLPLKKLPENYKRDLVEKFGKKLSKKQINTLLKNGALIISGENDRFESAYKFLESIKHKSPDGGVPTFITTDSIMHLFHIQFNELLKNLEINRLIPMLKEFLNRTIDVSHAQYKKLKDSDLSELSRRNMVYLSVAAKLLDDNYKLPKLVKWESEAEIQRITDHKGFYRSPLFSLDCPIACENTLYPGEYRNKGDLCVQDIKGKKVLYENKLVDFMELYRDVCSKKCYCEDYSQYVPRGHYTSSDELKNYFRAMTWLGRITFKTRSEDWTLQAILLTDSVKKANVANLWSNIYTVTGFFAGASDDLSFIDYDNAALKLFEGKFDLKKDLNMEIARKVQNEIAKAKGPEILGGFEFDTAGTLKDMTHGMRLIGQRYSIDSHILSDLVYKNVGVNPDSPVYNKVLSCGSYSRPKKFYDFCANMAQDKLKFWNEICSKALEMLSYNECGGLTQDEFYSVCRVMPTGLDIMSSLGSAKSDEILENEKIASYCDYKKKLAEMKNLITSYDINKWTQNLYNAWLWMIKPSLSTKPLGYPNWMRSDLWKKKDLITALSSWAQLRHDTILYIKQSYTWAITTRTTSVEPIPLESKYYGYVEPNPELFARAKFLSDYLLKGLTEQNVMTEEVKSALEISSEMMARLQLISENELKGIALSEEDYDYIENINTTFSEILEELASALKIEPDKKPAEGRSGEYKITENLEDKDAFKTTIVADVHTETNTKKVLEVGTGKIDWLIVAHASKDGRIGLAVGPMFSYYEFPWDMDDRLTDEKWREEVLKKTKRPKWISDFIN